ncbi:MAG: HPr family phosphocarrier protein [Lachnospiraceae bacterium]|nr:HPr family phosphocarrier protein [Lachnospiraceae bacterium]
MVSKRVTVITETGLHLKPAALFSREACKYESLITFTHDNTTANAKSILSILGACVRKGDEIEIVCSGVDEEEALAGMCRAVESGLEE